MASSGPGGAQQRRRPGPTWGKGRGTFNKGPGDGGGRGAAQKKAEPGGVYVQRKNVQRGEKDKKRWKSAQQINAGSTKEGQGFALWRKQKVQLEYKKLQRKQKKTTAPKDLYADNYPEHLKHLYLAEEERLKSLERKRKPEEDITQTTKEDITQTTETELTQKTEERVEEVPKKKFKNKTSIQKAKDEYKQVQNERANKRKEAEENRRQREEAKELYKKRKMEAFKVLSAKTKKGQPNFNVQMEYLLKKIQSKT